MQKKDCHVVKRSLRSINNCFKVPNIFINENQSFLTQNIEFIPKHIRRKLTQKEHLLCKDILDMQFHPERVKVDIMTVKTAVKQQQKYKKLLKQIQNSQLQHFQNYHPQTLNRQACIDLKRQETIAGKVPLLSKLEAQAIKYEASTQKDLNGPVYS